MKISQGSDFLRYNIVPEIYFLRRSFKWILEKSPFFRTLKLCKITLIYVHMYLYTAYYAYERWSTSETLKSSVTIARVTLKQSRWITIQFASIYYFFRYKDRSLHIATCSFPLFLFSCFPSLFRSIVHATVSHHYLLPEIELFPLPCSSMRHGRDQSNPATREAADETN